MAEVGDGVVHEVEAGGFGEGICEDLDVVAVLCGATAAVMKDSVRI